MEVYGRSQIMSGFCFLILELLESDDIAFKIRKLICFFKDFIIWYSVRILCTSLIYSHTSQFNLSPLWWAGGWVCWTVVDASRYPIPQGLPLGPGLAQGARNPPGRTCQGKEADGLIMIKSYMQTLLLFCFCWAKIFWVLQFVHRNAESWGPRAIGTYLS